MRSCVLLVFLLAACGDDDDGAGGLSDAPQAPDAPEIDGATPDAPPPAPVTLKISLNSAPVAGVQTYFLDADGTVVATVDTDDTGIAKATMVDGGSVTAIDPFGADPLASHQLRTFAGVKAGDNLVLSQDDSPSSFSFVVSAPVHDGAISYDVVTTCGTGSLVLGQPPTGELQLAGCGRTDMLVRAFTEAGTFFLYQPDVAVPAGGSLALTGDYQAMVQVKFSYSHLPAGTDSVQASHTLVTSRGSLDLGLNGSVFGIEADPASFAIEEPVIPGAVGIVDTTIRLFSGGIHHVIEHGGAGADYELDTQDLLLRDRPQSPSYNRTNRQLFWEEATAGQPSDLTIGSIDVTRFLPNETSEQWHWEIAAPYTAGKLELPLIPDWTPVFDDDVIVSTQINAKVPGHYDAIRPRVHDNLEPSAFLVAPTDRALTVEFQFQAGERFLGASGRRARE